MTRVYYAPVLTLIGSIAACLALSLPLALALLLSAAAAFATGLRAGYRRRELWRFGWEGVKQTRPVLSILFLVGLMIPLLMLGGAIPSLIYYGLAVVDVKWLLTVSFLLTAGVSYLLGTSVGTLSTIGLALLGVGNAAHVPAGMIAGALISGAMVGERFSPISSSRLLALSVIGAGERRVMRFGLPTGGSAFAAAAVLFFCLDVWRSGGSAVSLVAHYQRLLEEHYALSLGSLVPLLALVAAFALRMKAVPSLSVGVLSGAVQAAIVGLPPGTALGSVILYGVQLETGTELDRLVHGGGMLAILQVLLLISLAGFMNGILDRADLLRPMVNRLIGTPESVTALVAKTAALSLLAVIVSCNQTIPLLVVGATMRERFAGVSGGTELLGRTLLDATLVMPVLVPWNGLAMVMSVTLGVPTLESLPFLLYPLLLPLVTVLFARFSPARQVERPTGQNAA